MSNFTFIVCGNLWKVQLVQTCIIRTFRNLNYILYHRKKWTHPQIGRTYDKSGMETIHWWLPNLTYIRQNTGVNKINRGNIKEKRCEIKRVVDFKGYTESWIFKITLVRHSLHMIRKLRYKALDKVHPITITLSKK